MDNDGTRSGLRRFATAGALVAGGVLAGNLIVGTAASAAAAQAPSTAATEQQPGGQHDRGGRAGPRDESKSQRSDETLLTGDTAEKVKQAALAKYPGATIQRVETNSDGAYEAHLTTADGNRVTVEVGNDFAVTGEEQGGPHR